MYWWVSEFGVQLLTWGRPTVFTGGLPPLNDCGLNYETKLIIKAHTQANCSDTTVVFLKSIL